MLISNAELREKLDAKRDADAYLEYWIHFLRYEGRAAA